MDFDQLEMVAPEANNNLLILCYPHNPIGRVWSKEDLAKLSETCIRNNVFIITDEIHGDITYRCKYRPLASLSRGGARNCATCISPVKPFNLAGVANSMTVIDDDEKRSKCEAWFNRLEVNKNNVFTTAAMLAAYTKAEPWLDQVIQYLEQNIATLRTFLQQKLPSVKLVEPEGSYLLWLDFRELWLDVKHLDNFLVQEARIAGNPGQWFGCEGAGSARINIGCPGGILIQALDNLVQAVSRRVKSNA
ncbi:MAG: cystathionine beta-lyase [Gammaproteobacteria bacterium]|jgi:cystathionine beta-lyase